MAHRHYVQGPLNTHNCTFLSFCTRSAEAFHFYILAQKQLYDGETESAMRTALRLVDYEDIIDPADIFSLIALAAYYAKHYGQCSKAFIRLETLEVPKAEVERFAALALQIFMVNRPSDPPNRQHRCLSCSNSLNDWDSICNGCGQTYEVCVASGKTIMDSRYYMCPMCRHKSYESEIRGRSSCPLCHAPKTR